MKRFWGQGSMTRALQKVLRIAFEEMHIDQVHSSYFVDNLASKRVHEKLGFVPRTHGRHCGITIHCHFAPVLISLEHMSLTRDEWYLFNTAQKNNKLVRKRKMKPHQILLKLQRFHRCNNCSYSRLAYVCYFTGVHTIDAEKWRAVHG